MPTNYTGRFFTIAAVLFVSLIALFPQAFFAPFRDDVQFSLRPDLKPGIDMVGGASLLYEIKSEDGVMPGENLAERVMASLKKRVDPDGVRNLIWRPQGATRLEIQMPLSRDAGRANEQRKQFQAIERALNELSIRPAEVLGAVEDSTNADERRTRLATLASDSQTRATLFGLLASEWDQIQAAKAKQDAVAQAAAENRYDDLKDKIPETNLSSQTVQSVLDIADPKLREERLSSLRQRFGDFPEMQKRIDAFVAGYREYVKVRNAIDSTVELKRLLRGSGVLEFYIKAVPPGLAARAGTTTGISDEEYNVMVQRLEREGPLVRAGDIARWFLVDRPEEYRDFVHRYNDRPYVLLHTTSDKAMVHREGAPNWALKSAGPALIDGERKVNFQFDAVGSRLFGELTTNNVGRPLAIVLDGKMISAPNINQPIYGSGVISGGRGGFTEAEQRYLVSTLDAGSLPAQLTDDPIMERTVGPQLGEENLRRGLFACFAGLLVVFVFMIGYYYTSGLVASIAVLMNMVIILGAMAALNATFTLPSVAGIVLTIGMAVDANVLIYERLREEQLRGLSLKMALRNAYDRAFSAIIDSNLTTGITSICLYWFGSEEVKGFGLTLLIGIVASLFTALFVTKTIFGVMIDKFGVTRLGSIPMTFPGYDRALRPSIDWMRLAPAFFVFSTLFIVVGLTLFGIRYSQGKVLDVEFASGTAVQFELKQPLTRDQVQEIFDAEAIKHPDSLAAAQVVTVGERNLEYEVVTLSTDAPKVKEAVLRALGDKLNLAVGSSFAHSGLAAPDAMRAGAIVPIDRNTRIVAGFAPDAIRKHIGGAAIVLRDLDPPITARSSDRSLSEEVQTRIDSQRLESSSSGRQMPYRPFDVEVTPDGKTAIIMFSDSNIPLSADRVKWEQELVAPMWQLVRNAIDRPAELQKVTNFDAQVAGEFKRDATVALILSVLGIVVYTWFRFGNFRFGSATVVATIHDALFVVAAVGIAHYLNMVPALGAALNLSDFRVNLTFVAALLTVIGWSMNDTVVIFDRVRENRGKLGVLTAQIINDSINQTMSRTLLTGGTTVATLFIMFIFGGPGIHSFTFAMLIGIIIGTYSSVAIAAPLLLAGSIGGRKDQTSKPADSGQLQRVG